MEFHPGRYFWVRYMRILDNRKNKKLHHRLSHLIQHRKYYDTYKKSENFRSEMILTEFATVFRKQKYAGIHKALSECSMNYGIKNISLPFNSLVLSCMFYDPTGYRGCETAFVGRPKRQL